MASCGFRPLPRGRVPYCLQAACPIPVSTFPRPSNPSTVIPAKAGIQCLGMDSGSPFHSARNDGQRGGCFFFFPLCQVRGHGWHPAGFGPFPGDEYLIVCRQHIRSLPAHSHARRTHPPSLPRKRESSAAAWIPGLRFTPPGMTGRGGCFFFPLCQLCGHGWRPAGFAPLPRGRVPFCLQQQKGTNKCRPGHPADSCASRPDPGWPTRPFARPTQAIPGLIRPGPRCSGGTKGKLARLAGLCRQAVRCSAKAQRAVRPTGYPIPISAFPPRHSRESGNPVPRRGFRVSVSLRPE